MPNEQNDPPPMSTREYQDEVGKTIADFDMCIAKRAEQREQLLRTKNIVDGMTVDETIGDRSAVAYLLNQSRAIADIALGHHDQLVADLVTRRDELAAIRERN